MAKKDFIASFDLETSNLYADFGVVLCGVVKPWGKAPVVFQQTDVSSDDSEVVKKLVAELDKYTILLAHNGVRFDRPFLNTRATKYGMPILSPRSNIIDPVIVARRHLRMGGNSLENLARYLNTKHQKSKVEGYLWQKATLDGDKDALAAIIKHCIIDVLVLEEVTEMLVPFIGRITEWGSA